MDLNSVLKACRQLQDQPYQAPIFEPPIAEVDAPQPEPNPDVQVSRLEMENLSHFTQIWTDVLDIEDVNAQYQKSDYQDQTQFETDNHLYNMGFFYVKVNPKCPAIEFLGLLAPIPFEQFRVPNTNEVSYSLLSELFVSEAKADKIAIQLMVLGHFFQYWLLINPYQKMIQTGDLAKLILSGMGNLRILIVPNYIQKCYEVIHKALSQLK